VSTEPAIKRAIAYFDGQNLFNMAKECFGYSWPNFDPYALAKNVCAAHGWDLQQIRFYTGLPPQPDPRRTFWEKKFATLGRQGAFLYWRDTQHGQEKGIDIRIALDIVGGALRNEFDVAVIFSQDTDFSEVADEIRWIAKNQGRWIKIACAFPYPTRLKSAEAHKHRGIPRTDWIRINKETYDSCLDPANYRAKPPASTPAPVSRVTFRKKPPRTSK
jgi:hypothetical protein